MYCGPRCLVYLEQKQGRELSLGEASRLSGTTKEGTYPEDLVKGLEALGYRASLKQKLTWGDLSRFVKQGKMVIVDWWSVLNAPGTQATLPDGHWSVVISMNRTSITLYDPDPERSITLPKSFWMAHWFDYNQDGEVRHDMLQAAVVGYRPKKRVSRK